MKDLLATAFTTDTTPKEGVVISRRPTYLQILYEKKLIVAHFSVNKQHYQVGSKVVFTTYQHEGVPCAKISGTVKVRTETTALLHQLYEKADAEFIIYDLVDIALHRTLSAFERANSVKYVGVIRQGSAVKYLFQK